jgi:hypothetical protein
MVRLLYTSLVSLCLSGLCLAQEADANSAASAQAAAPEPRAVGFQISAGFGIGSRAFILPTREGVQQLADSPFPAADLKLVVRGRSRERLAVELIAVYQTSVAWRIEERPLFGLPESMNARSQRFELGVAPVVRLGASATAPAIAFPIGFAMRSFWPRLHQFPVRDYVLGGPQLRAELRLRLGGHLRMQVGPELQWLLLSNPSLLAMGISHWAGFAVGAEAVLEASLDGPFRIAIAYRESRAYVPSATFRLEDTERYLSARIGGAFE